MSGTPAVFVADDDVDLAEIIRVVLGTLAPGMQVELCADAGCLLDRIAAAPAGSLVLIDRRLGQTESYGVIAELHGRRDDLTLIMLSAVLSAADYARALAAGAHTAMEKPAALAGWRVMLGTLLATVRDNSSAAA